MARITIGQLAARTGLRASAIRYYEAEGLLPPAAREHGRRVYDTSVFQRLAVIELAKTAGFTLSEIKVVLSAASASRPSVAWKKLTTVKRKGIERELRRLALMKRVLASIARCRCRDLDECGRAFTAAVENYSRSERGRPVSKPTRPTRLTRPIPP